MAVSLYHKKVTNVKIVNNIHITNRPAEPLIPKQTNVKINVITRTEKSREVHKQ